MNGKPLRILSLAVTAVATATTFAISTGPAQAFVGVDFLDRDSNGLLLQNEVDGDQTGCKVDSDAPGTTELDVANATTRAVEVWLNKSNCSGTPDVVVPAGQLMRVFDRGHQIGIHTWSHPAS
ncbi:hypothetical protein [Streptomyces chattanoogensis]|uniref:hypothetical protein n=1 Tax=Streptomyces chattanoogensis TaxID=66876 RepID=UPI00367C6DF4